MYSVSNIEHSIPIHKGTSTPDIMLAFLGRSCDLWYRLAMRFLLVSASTQKKATCAFTFVLHWHHSNIFVSLFSLQNTNSIHYHSSLYTVCIQVTQCKGAINSKLVQKQKVHKSSGTEQIVYILANLHESHYISIESSF